jgi:hypothetical protein
MSHVRCYLRLVAALSSGTAGTKSRAEESQPKCALPSFFPQSLKKSRTRKGAIRRPARLVPGYPAGPVGRRFAPRLAGCSDGSAARLLSLSLYRCDWTTCVARYRLVKAVKLQRCQLDRPILNASWRAIWRATDRRPPPREHQVDVAVSVDRNGDSTAAGDARRCVTRQTHVRMAERVTAAAQPTRLLATIYPFRRSRHLPQVYFGVEIVVHF